jgi:glutathione synthase/RimK-type ligase-like ATP-grasp enzyme
MSNLKIYPYKVGSASVKKLKTETGATIIKLENSRYRYRNQHTVINWGNSQRTPNMVGVPMLNEPEAVAIASNKLLTFEELSDNNVATVPFTTDVDVAQQWLEEGAKVFARAKLNGHSGDGIGVIEHDTTKEFALQEAQRILDDAGLGRIADTLDHDYQLLREETLDLPDVPLYTKGISNKGEYRVNVFNGDIILYQKKSRRVNEDGEVETAEGEEADVRNLASNWVYRTGKLKSLERVENLAIDAIEALGLDFGAVDIIMDNDGEVYVLEVNTAPGLGNTDSIEAYVEAISNLV